MRLPLLGPLLRKRRLQFLRHLVQSNQNRVLAALLGRAEWDREDVSMTNAHGVPTEHAPPWIRMVHKDAQTILPMWTGFREEWRDTIEHECTDEVLDNYLALAQPHLHFHGGRNGS